MAGVLAQQIRSRRPGGHLQAQRRGVDPAHDHGDIKHVALRLGDRDSVIDSSHHRLLPKDRRKTQFYGRSPLVSAIATMPPAMARPAAITTVSRPVMNPRIKTSTPTYQVMRAKKRASLRPIGR